MAEFPPPPKTELLKRLAGLPPFPTTALRLLNLSTESATAIQDFEATFKGDPALASDLLMAANSVEFGLQSRVESIRQAVTLLGLDRVSSLSVTIAMKFYMREAPRMRVVQPMWSHGVAAAVIAETLGVANGSSVRGLYTAGLVHDVGRLGMMMAAGPEYGKFLVQSAASHEAAEASELEQFGVTHTEAGAIMAKSWGFPESLCQAISCHHDETTPHTEPRTRFVQYACRWATALGYGEHAGAARIDPKLLLSELRERERNHSAMDQDRLRLKISSMLFGMSQAKKT